LLQTSKAEELVLLLVALLLLLLLLWPALPWLLLPGGQ
jgi:hypothetical protein